METKSKLIQYDTIGDYIIYGVGSGEYMSILVHNDVSNEELLKFEDFATKKILGSYFAVAIGRLEAERLLGRFNFTWNVAYKSIILTLNK